MNKIITDYLDAKQLADRLTALELHSTSELARLELERDDALSQIVQAECRAERFCQERDEAREAWYEMQSSFEHSRDEVEKLMRERDEAREKHATEATDHMLAVNKICGERDEARTGWDQEITFNQCQLKDARQLADRLTELELHSTNELARLEQELADAREEAHRFRSLYYAKSGINKSASAFPWEDAK